MVIRFLLCFLVIIPGYAAAQDKPTYSPRLFMAEYLDLREQFIPILEGARSARGNSSSPKVKALIDFDKRLSAFQSKLLAFVFQQPEAGPIFTAVNAMKQINQCETLYHMGPQIPIPTFLLEIETKYEEAWKIADAKAQAGSPLMRSTPTDSSLPTVVATQAAPSQEMLVSGRSLYHGKGACWICHGGAGRGDGEKSAEMNPRPTDFTKPASFKLKTDADWYRAITQGMPGTAMVAVAPMAKLSDEEIWAIIAYVRTLARN